MAAPFELPALPFEDTALAPVISAETLSFHYGKHHKAYVDNLNKMVEGTKYADMSLEEVIKESAKEGNAGVFNNSAQIWNHTFYWNCLSADGGAPSAAMAEMIDR
ncbi:MAG: superoxide dismutase [Fe], partial [Pseudomonadota bacterium]